MAQNNFFIINISLLVLLGVASGSTVLDECYKSERHVNIQTNGAQVILGAIFPIHKKGSTVTGCGEPDEGTMQLYEAIRWSLELINKRELAGTGIKIGIKAWDNCYTPVKALWDTLDFYPEDQSQEAYCNVSRPVLTLGILGPFTSWSSLKVAQFLSMYPASQISYGAASTELNDKILYPYFMRTVPSTLMYANNLLSLLRKLNWLHVVVIYTDDSYGMDSYKEFLKIAHNTEICISQAIQILSTDTANNIFLKLGDIVTSEAFGGLMFSPSATTNKIMEALARRGDAGNLQWIVNDLHIEKASTNPYHKGSLLMAPKSTQIDEFREHWITLDPRNPPSDNPWYSEWYMTTHLCKLSNSVSNKFLSYPDCVVKSYSQRKSDFEQYFYVEPAVISLFTFAKAFKSAKENLCFLSTGICGDLLKLSAKQFHQQYLKAIDFSFNNVDGVPDLVGKRISFDSHGNIENPEFLLWNYRDENGIKKFVEVGNFVNSWNLKPLVFYDYKRQLPLNTSVTSKCPAKGCPICLSPSLKLEIFHIPGDILIGGIFSIHNRGKLPFTCGSINLEDIQAMMAFRYAIENIKSHFPQILPGISIGAVYSDVCENSGLIENLLAGFHGERQVYREKESNRLIDPNLVVAYITSLENSQATTASSLLGQFKFPQIESKATTTGLSSRRSFPYFSRTSPSEQMQFGVISQILKKNNWTYIQVVSDRQEAVASFQKLTTIMSICITAVHMIESKNYDEIVSGLRGNSQARVVVVIADPTDVNGILKAMKRQKVSNNFLLIGTSSWGVSKEAVKGEEDTADGSLTLTASNGLADSFKRYLDKQDIKSDKILTAWYQALFDCYLNAGSKGSYQKECGNEALTSSSKFSIGKSVHSTINAVYVVAAALNRTILYYCGANDGVCPAFRASHDNSGAMILNIMRDITIFGTNNQIFTMRNGEGSTSFHINQFTKSNGYTKIGSYNSGNAELTLSKTISLASTCPSFCYECYRINNNQNHINNEAQLMIGAIFGVHNALTTGTLTHCGKIGRVHGYQFVSAMEYAISTVNNNRAPVSLHGIPLGSLILDSCKISRQAFGLMSGVYSGAQQISNTFKSNNIYAWITETSGSAEQMGKLAAKLGVPLLSPAATSKALVNSNVYTTFYRTVPGEDLIASAIAKVCNAMSFNFIQVVLSGDDLSENSLKVLESKTELEGVCIIAKYRFSRGMSAADIMQSLRKSMSPTVLFVTQREMDELLANKRVPADDNLVFITPDVLSDSASSYPKEVKNLLAFRNKPTINTTSYLNYMSSLRPDVNNLYGFFEEYYQDIFECDLPRNYKFGKQCSTPFSPITQSPNFSLDNIISSTVNAVYATVQALDTTLQQLCGQGYTGICYEFYVKGRQQEYLLRNLEKAKVKNSSLSSAFQFVNREGRAEYDVMRYDEAGVQHQVGTFNGINLRMGDLSRFYSSVVSFCPDKCDNCVQQNANFTYIPGDIVIAGVFDVHDKGSNLFSCGNIKLYNGFQNLEAFNFAIGEVNKKQGIFQDKLKGIQLGGVGLDSCDNDVMAANLVSNLNNGMMKVDKKTVHLNPSDIYAYIGGGTSDSSIYLDRILRSMQIPLVSYAATTTQLNDKYEFPNFLRTVPTDDRLAKAITSFLKHHKIPYVQIVHSSSSFGAKGAEVFKEYALEHKICVAQTVQFIEQGISMADSANNVMKTLLNKPLANTIVIFAEVLHTRELLKVLKQEPVAIRNNYKFIAAGLWGQRLDVITGIEDVAAGSVTIAVDGIDIQEFDKYLESKIPDSYRDNPWFTEYYEGLFDCYLAKPKTNLRTKCSNSLNRVTKSAKYAQDDSVLNVVNSVFAVALGIDKTLTDICGVNYTGLCSAFKSANRNYQLYNNIKNIQFKEYSDVLFKFNQEGDSNKGYKFFQVQNISPTRYGYKEIASANVLGTLTEVSNDFIAWKTACTTLEACSECFIYQKEAKRYTLHPNFKISNATTPIIVGIFDVHSAGRNLIQCGNINVEDTLHLVAFFDSIERANAANPKEKIVGLAIDTCGHSLHVDQDTYSLLSSGTICHDDNLMLNKSNIFSFFTMHQANAIASQRVLPYFKMSYLSPDLTDIRFDDLRTYKYLFRTKGSLYEKVVLISRVLKTKQITPVAVVYSDDVSHKAQLETFKEESSKDGICIEEILKASDDNALTSQAKKRATRAIVLLTNLRDGTSILNQTKHLSSQNQQTYLFIGVEDWMQNLDKDLISTDQVTLLITEKKIKTVPLFEKKIKKMSFQNKLGLPDNWFDEFYQKLHNCSLTPSQYSKPCGRYETVTDSMIAKIDQSSILNTIAGVDALTESIQNWRTTCNVDKPPAGCQLSTPEGRLRYWSQLNDVEFKTNKTLLKPEASLDFRFSRQVWSPGYLVQELHSSEQYTFQTVATVSNGVLKPSVPNFKTVTEEVLQTILFCPGCRCLNEQGASESNAPGSSSLVGATNLKLKESTIRNYFHYDDDDVRLFDWPLWAIILAVLTSIGIIFTVLLFFYLLIAYPIRGGTTSLGFLFLIGILGIYGVNFAFFAQASITVCAARRFTMAVVYALCFACLCVKSVDNWRYRSNEIDSHDYRRLSSSLALGVVTLIIVLVQIMLNIEWLLLVKPSSVTLYPTMSVRRGSPDTLVKMRHDYEWCSPADSYDTGMSLSFIFVIILDVFAICFGSLLWDNEKNYFESRWIVVACLCSSSCFLVWMVVSTSSDAVFRDPAVAIGNFINATALLAVMPLRKAILLVKIKKEVEEEEKEKPYSSIYHNIDNNKVFSDYAGNNYSEKFA